MCSAVLSVAVCDMVPSYVFCKSLFVNDLSANPIYLGPSKFTFVQTSAAHQGQLKASLFAFLRMVRRFCLASPGKSLDAGTAIKSIDSAPQVRGNADE